MSYPGTIPDEDECRDCGATVTGPHRPLGGHYPECPYFQPAKAAAEGAEQGYPTRPEPELPDDGMDF